MKNLKDDFERAKSNKYVKKNVVKLMEEALGKVFPPYKAGKALFTFIPDLYRILSAEGAFRPKRDDLVSSTKEYRKGKISLKDHQKKIGRYGESIRQKNLYVKKAIEHIVDEFYPGLELKKKDELMDKLYGYVVVLQRKDFRNQLVRKTGV